jgi:hypothetical protein
MATLPTGRRAVDRFIAVAHPVALFLLAGPGRNLLYLSSLVVNSCCLRLHRTQEGDLNQSGPRSFTRVPDSALALLPASGGDPDATIPASMTSIATQPTLAERGDIHKSCKSLEVVVNLLNDYCEAAGAVVQLQKKLAKAVRDASSSKITPEHAG